MSEEEGEKWGLVPTHAYAVLDIREYKVSSETEDAFRYVFWNLSAMGSYFFFFYLMAYIVYFVLSSIGKFQKA